MRRVHAGVPPVIGFLSFLSVFLFLISTQVFVSTSSKPFIQEDFVGRSASTSLTPDVGPVLTTPPGGAMDLDPDVTEYGITLATDNQIVVTFPDPGLNSTIRQAINKPSGDIYASELAILEQLDASGRSISNLTGIEFQP